MKNMQHRKKVLTFGTFDVLHPGHIDFLRQAKKYGDFLIVSIAREKFVKEIKGHAPLHNEKDRKNLMQALRLVDKVVLGSKNDYISHIVKIRPDVIVLGHDQKVFTEGLKAKLAAKGLAVKIVRARPYKSKYYQSRLLKPKL